MKLKAALADTEAALREYAEIEGKAEDEIDRNDKLVQEMLTHGKHPNLSFLHLLRLRNRQHWRCLKSMDRWKFSSISYL